MEKKYYTQDEYEKANAFSITALAESLGYTLKRKGNSRLSINEMDSVEIDPEKNCFYRHSQSIGGGPVQFLCLTRDITIVQAVQELCKDKRDFQAFSKKPVLPTQSEEAEKTAFVLPERAPHHRHVFAYLNKERKIAPGIISEMMHQKRLYETVFSNSGRDYFNCVFVGMDADGAAVHAAMRYARRKSNPNSNAWRVISGSDTAHPFSMEGTGKTLFVYESAIDALSGATVDLMMERDWQQAHRIALGGLSRKPIEQYLTDHPDIDRIVFCLDNDFLAEKNYGQIAAVEMAEHFHEIGYATERLVTDAKDMNAALVEFVEKLERGDAETTEWEESSWENGI